MSCPNNPRKFWIFEWQGDHTYSPDLIKRFGSKGWAKYEITLKCSRCGVSLGTSIKTEAELQKRGYDIRKLQEIPDWLDGGSKYRPIEKFRYDYNAVDFIVNK